MKKKIFLFLILHALIGNAQNDATYADQKISIGLACQIINFRPYVGYQFGRHQINAGVYIDNRPQYNLDLSEFGSYHYYLSGPSKYKIAGANLNYRIFPFKPQRIISFYLENKLEYSNDNFYLNNVFHQKINRIRESILGGMEIKFLNRFSFFLSAGPTIHLFFAKNQFIDTGGLTPYQLFKPSTLGYSIFTGIQVGLF